MKKNRSFRCSTSESHLKNERDCKWTEIKWMKRNREEEARERERARKLKNSNITCNCKYCVCVCAVHCILVGAHCFSIMELFLYEI